MTKQQNLLGTCDLLQAEIAFFPLFNSSIVEQSIPVSGKKILYGLMAAPHIVVNWLCIWMKSYQTFISKNIPLEFRIFDHNFRLSPADMDEFYNSLMHYVQKNGYPVIWIIAPGYMCEYIYKTCLKDTAGNFYYHNSLRNEEDVYFSISQLDCFEIHPVSPKKLFRLN